MRKKILLICLILVIPLFIISCKKTDDSSPVTLNIVDIDVLSNKDLLSIVNDDSLDEGVYLIQTKSNKYIFFNGKKNSYIDIYCSLDNETLIINATTKSNVDDNKKLYLIQEKNTTSSNERSQFYQNITLIINNKESSFNSSFINN
ncbi:MAG: hypothetical protein RR712_02170 [Terrisporobacter sp.]